MPLSPGTRLGPYEIVAAIGAGGMGEVYRARDTRLGRDVALKILPSGVADDPVRRQRFELEARAVAALSHPNIVAVFDVGREAGVSYIVSELVDGESLRGAKFGLRKTLDIALQIGGGLAAAHAAGIVHRDLKPDNILLTRDGRVKILDFGLAKVQAQPTLTGATETLTVHSEPGTVMGTVGYMSPEQVRGLPADHRSDIFSFGVILHELFTGERAFHGETAIDTMQAILREDPPELPETVPAGIRQIVGHCLEKDPANRFQSARDLSFAIGALAQGNTTSSKVPASIAGRSPWHRRIAIAAALLAVIALALAVDRFLRRTPAPESWSGTLLGGPENAMGPRISPDGHTLAFQAFVGELTQVAIMKPETGNWTVLTHNSERGWVNEISWSPDGSRIYYDRITDVPRGIFSVPVFGGDEHLVLPDAQTPEALPDGSLMVLRLNAERQKQVFRFWPETGQLQPFAVQVSPDEIYPQMRVFSDGRRAVVLGQSLQSGQAPRTGIRLLDVISGGERILGTPNPVYSLAVTRDGKSVLFQSNLGDLGAVLALPATGQGPPRTLFTTTEFMQFLDSGPDGSIYADPADRPTTIVRFAEAGGPLQKIGVFTSMVIGRALLPDGRVLGRGTQQGRLKLMVLEAGKEPVPLVNTSDDTATPATAVGSSEVAFGIRNSTPTPHWELAIADISTGTIQRRIAFDKGAVTSLAATPDGKTLFLAAGGSIWSLPATGGEPKRIRSGDSVGVDPTGRYLLVQVIESPTIHLVRAPLDGAAEQEIHLSGPYHLTLAPIASEMISKDGRLVVALASPDSWFSSPGIVDLTTGRVTRIPVDRFYDYILIGWGPDGKITASATGLKSSLWRFQSESH